MPVNNLLMRLKLAPLAVFSAVVALTVVAHAQFPGPGGGPGRALGGPARVPIQGGMVKLFENHKAFTANVLMQTQFGGSVITMPGKLSFLDRKMRFEMDTTRMTGGNLPPGALEQMKAMGMAEVISIARPDKKENYIVYPGLKAYAAMPAEESASSQDSTELKKTEVGKEPVNGRPTTKYKVMVKDDSGKDQEVHLWSDAELKGFPVKIEVVSEAGPSTVTFSDVKLARPEDSLFDPPADLQRNTDVGTMMREAMMKRFSAPGGVAPAPRQ
jgi:hypothetical protein